MRAPYYDEQAMSDPDVIDKMINHMSEEMTNDLTDKIVAEMTKTDNKIYGADFDFDVISDAIASFPDEETEDETLFMLVNRKDMTTFRKNLKDQLKYVEDFVRKGYVGTVCGVPIYTSDAVPVGKIFLGTSKAVTIFVKKGVETERERDANTRKWIQYIRKVMLVALTNYKKMIEITSADDPREGYTVLTEQPDDWATDYDDYYTYDAAGEKMVAVTGDAAPEFVAGKYWEKDE